MKPSHSMPPPPRRTRADSDVSGPLDDERPPSRDHRGVPPQMRGDDRYRFSSHRSYDGRKSSGSAGGYDDYPPRERGSGSYKDYDFDDNKHSSRESWTDHGRQYDDKHEPRNLRDNRDRDRERDRERDRDLRDSRDRDMRDHNRDKKDYDNYSKVKESKFIIILINWAFTLNIL